MTGCQWPQSGGGYVWGGEVEGEGGGGAVRGLTTGTQSGVGP